MGFQTVRLVNLEEHVAAPGIGLIPYPGDGNQWSDDSDATYARTYVGDSGPGVGHGSGSGRIVGDLPAIPIPAGATNVEVTARARIRVLVPAGGEADAYFDMRTTMYVPVEPGNFFEVAADASTGGGGDPEQPMSIGDWLEYPTGPLTQYWPDPGSTEGPVPNGVVTESFIQAMRDGSLVVDQEVSDQGPWSFIPFVNEPDAHVDMSELWIDVSWRIGAQRWPLRQNQRVPNGLLASQGDNARWPIRASQRRW